MTTAVTFVDRFGGGLLPANAQYVVSVTPSQACFATVTARTMSGFNVVLTPPGSNVTLSAGTFDVAVTA